MNGRVELTDPFDVADIEWRIGATTKDGSKGLLVYYINARSVMNRLDAYCAETGGTWQTSYVLHPDGKHVECRLTLDMPVKRGEEQQLVAVTRADVGEPSQGMGDALKGAYSSALKRVGAQFGIGRYLYEIEDTWLPVEAAGNSHRLTKQGQREAEEHYKAFINNLGKPVTQREQVPDAEVAQTAQGARQAAKGDRASAGDISVWWGHVSKLGFTREQAQAVLNERKLVLAGLTRTELNDVYRQLVELSKQKQPAGTAA